MRPTIAVLLALVALLAAACTGAADGSACVASEACESGLCYANLCLAPAGDHDGDGVTNRREHELGSHPNRADSDGDGLSDGVEVGAGAGVAPDSDGDGNPDVVESLLLDADADCLVDQSDANDAVVNADPTLLARDACGAAGVCAGQTAQIIATCQVGLGLLQCDFAAVAGWHADERCDGLDDDCDGQTDEGFAWRGKDIGSPCEGIGACGAGVVECQAGVALCSTQPGGTASSSKEEACNSVDDDCDGQTDEGFAAAGAPVGSPCLGHGECGVGVAECGPQGLAICASDPGGSASQVTAELCNGLDDDCDGATDDGIGLGGVALGEPCLAKGACGAGVVACTSGGAAACSSDAGGVDSKASPEACNGADDDCDGQTDEGQLYQGVALGAPCVGVGACGAGIVVCGGNGKATCSSLPEAGVAPAKSELCNGSDDDCDGQTDEGFAWQGSKLGASCPGVGACGVGQVECNATGGVTCSTLGDGSAAQATAELCDGQDDDCDGLTDEDANAASAPACVALGVCAGASGEAVCTAGSWSCAFPTVAGWQGTSETSCDGKDNDCDGDIDEALAKAWAAAPVAADDGGPAPRRLAAVTSADDGVYVAGGEVGDVAVIGEGAVPGSAAAAVTLDDQLWRFDAAAGRWQRLARDGALARRSATLAYLPAGLVGKSARLWLLGGQTSTGAQAGAVAIDPATGAVSPLAEALVPPARVGAACVVEADKGRIWLLGGAPAGPPASPVLRFDVATGGWLAGATLPQPSGEAPVAGASSACRDAGGALWWLAEGPEGRALRRLDASGAWQERNAGIGAGADAAAATLLCDVSAGEHWLIGAAAVAGGLETPLGLRRYTVAADAWSAPAVDPSPPRLGPIVGRVASKTLVASGRSADGTWQTGTVLGSAGWQTLTDGPLPALHAALAVEAGGTWLRIGGVRALGPAVAPSLPWRRAGAAWQPLADPDGLTIRLRPLALSDGPGARVVVFGGVAPPWPLATLDAAAADLAPSGGGLQVSADGTIAPLGAAALAALPALRTAAAHVSDVAQGAAHWLLGRSAAGDALQLWRIDLAADGAPAEVAAKLYGAVAPAAVGWQPGAALVRLGAIAEPVLVQASGALTVRRWHAATKAWTIAASDPSAAPGQVQALAQAGADDALLLLTPASAGKVSTRRLRWIAGAALLEPGPAVAADLPRVDVVAYSAPASQALLSGLHQAGLQRGGTLAWPWNCLP